MKRLCSILLLLMFCTSFPALAAETGELLQNGGFEAWENGKPTDWYCGYGAFGTDCTQSSVSNSGTWCAAVATNKTVYLSAAATGMQAGTDYTFTGFVKQSAGSSVAIEISFTHIDTDTGNLVYHDTIHRDFTPQKNAWEKLTFSFTAAKNATAATIFLRTYGSAQVAWDDISVYGLFELPAVYDDSFVSTPPLEDAPELIQNGDFSATTAVGGAANWIPDRPSGFPAGQNGWVDNPCVSYAADLGRTNGAARVTSEQGQRPFVYQTVTGITPGAAYQASVWIRGLAETSTATMKYEFYNEPILHTQYSCGESLSSKTLTIRADGYQQYGQVFRVPDTCKMIAIYLRVFERGEVCFDDASLYQTAAPEFFTSDTDKVFYYTDDTEVIARAQLYAYTSAEGATVQFELLDGTRLLQSNPPAVVAPDKRCSATFPMRLLAEKKHAYTVRATLRVGGVAETHESDVFRYDRPLCLDAEGNYRRVTAENGVFTVAEDVFHPIFLDHATVDDYARLSSAGINVVQLYSDETTASRTCLETLDCAHENGLMVLVGLYNNMRPAGHPANAAPMRRLVQSIMYHPAVFGYIIMDEPYNHDPYPEENLTESYRLVRDTDSAHPVFVMENASKNYKKVARFTDILGIDPYPQGSQNPLTFVGACMQTAMAAAQGKPVYCLLQTFSYGGYFPTPSDLDSMLYQAFAGGARGIGYFCFRNCNGTQELDETVLWATLQDFYTQRSAVYFHGIAFFQNGQEATAAAPGTVQVKGFAPPGSALLAALYRGDELYAITRIRNTAETYEMCTADITVPHGGMTVKGFLWYPQLAPVCNSLQITDVAQ